MGTFTQLLYHFVFSTKFREPSITEDLTQRLYSYMGGILRAEKSVLYEIGGIEDHVHLLVRMKPDISVSNLMRVLKSRSSGWVHDTFPHHRTFGWQDGYGAFSVSKSQENAVKMYIANQREHHRKEDFKTEYIRLLDAHEIEYDLRYVFD